MNRIKTNDIALFGRGEGGKSALKYGRIEALHLITWGKSTKNKTKCGRDDGGASKATRGEEKLRSLREGKGKPKQGSHAWNEDP